MSGDLILAKRAAEKAGNIIREDYTKTKTISKKAINDYVTETDVKAEKSIISDLKSTGYSFLGEESGEINKHTRKRWIIDPLDGTNNFIHGIPFFSTSIALMDGDEILLGVVYDPITKECFSAEKTKGAYMNGIKIKVSNRDDFDGSNILIEHNRSERSIKDFVTALTKLLKNKGPVLLRQGSTALMLCYVANGSAEAFLSAGDAIYDYAAGLIIAKEAGAIISDWKGNKWDNSNSYILASNPGLNDKILKRLKGIQR